MTYNLDSGHAVIKYIRMSPRKLRRVANEIRGKGAIDAITKLKFMPYSAASVIRKAVQSAISNAGEKGLDIDSLTILEIFVDGGVTLKRIRPRAQGRAYPIKKRTSNVTVVVG
ncbi:MAG: 50S ribosomal protein L22 [Candidatus Sericytochromatia bacterium]|nr:MAG: 50S ribosomal protein L22 [Candidatus Sericytochromatia bacterium]